MEIISDEVVKCIPFSPGPIITWNTNTDLQNFLYAINNLRGVVLRVNGQREVTDYRDSGKSAYEQGQKEFREWAYRFGKSARDNSAVPEASSNLIDAPDFYENSSFGLAAKYIIAWNEGVMSALSSGAFFSIAHILESVDDLTCSLNLAAQVYYKHAHQALRSFLEDVILPIHFAQHRSEYLQWKTNNYRTPTLRGRKGMLRGLANDQIISQSLADEVAQLYDNLNGFVHGSEKRLINKGQYSRTWVGHGFSQDDYLEWCGSVEKTILLGIKLLRINLGQWEDLRSQRLTVCPICHNDKDFDVETFSFGGENFTKYLCQKCGDQVTHNYEGREAYKQTYAGRDVSYQYLTG